MMILLIWIAFAVCIGATYQDSSYTMHGIFILEEDPQEWYENEPSISYKEVDECFEKHKDAPAHRLALEQELARKGRVIKPNATGDARSVHGLFLIRRKNTDVGVHMHESKQLVFELVTDDLIQRHNLSKQDVWEKLPQQPLDRGQYCRQARDECIAPRPVRRCDPNSRYRRIDGTCNNLQNTDWGSAGVCFRRLLPPSYVGQSGFRQSVYGGPLPLPRTLSLNVHNHFNRPTNYVNHMYMFFGQLLDHDISQAPFSTTVDNQAIECCPPSNNSHPQCAPIIISRNDPFYSQFGTTCMNFVRSAMCPTCRLGSREQTNQITAFIDASFVYGNSENETMALRANDGTGKLRSVGSGNEEFLPPSPDPSNDFCSFPDTNDICFQAGDARANQHPPLASLHTIFMREHNRLCDGFRALNPSWDDERLFEEARKIVGAEMQVIVYQEYLPITLGADRMSYFNLWLSRGRTTAYNKNANPSLPNEFSGAAFRFGHSLVNSMIARTYLNGTTNQPFQLRDVFFQPFGISQGDIDPLMSGVVKSPAQWFDRHLVPDVTNYLYRLRGTPSGLDLASINIQRGRDHGLPTYVDMVHFCNDNSFKITCFEDLYYNNVMTRENMQVLKSNYRHVNDMDLWTGILSESYLDNAVVGPTAACVIGYTFNKLKFGDRFYFEHRNQAGSFTYQQIQELRKISLAKIICLNTDVQTMPLDAMLYVTRNNPTIYCNKARGVNLSYWRE